MSAEFRPELPDAAAWRHHEARTGFEVVFFRRHEAGYRIEGQTTAVEDGHTWAVSYELDVDANCAPSTPG